MIIILQPKHHFHLTLFFLTITSSSSLFHTTHARLGATPALSPHVPNEGANTMLPMLLVVFVFAFFVTGFCSLYIRYCSERYMVEQNDAVRKGIDPEVLATCPIVVYSTVKNGQRHVALQCAVCLGEFCDLDKLRLLPKCSHVFHPGCIDTWLASHVTCPVCRAEISGENGVRQVFVESTVRRVEGENGSGVCGSVDGFVGKGNGSSKVSAFGFGVLVRSHSTGHSLVEPGKSVERFIKKQIVEDKGGNLMVMKRSASYDVVLQIEEDSGEERGGGEEGSSSSRKGKSNGFGCGSSGAREDKESRAKTIFEVV